ncbi:MAG: hypothetical protein HY744_19665 [Deltaproteobacteria bacterium]|nr:hypothetical protein [Deltaproteobacteria bacterium]
MASNMRPRGAITGSMTVLNIVYAARARKRKLAIAALALLAVIGVGGFFIARQVSSDAAARVVTSWSSLHRCLLGKPLGEGERPSVRLRAIQLTAMAMAEAAPAPGKEEPWPRRCGPSGHALSEALKDTGRAKEGEQDLAFWADKLAALLDDKSGVAQDLTEIVDRIFELGKKEGIGLVQEGNVPEPPAAVEALTVDALGSVKPLSKLPFDLKNVRVEQHTGETLRFIVDDEQVGGSPALCQASGSADSVGCAPLPEGAGKASQGGVQLLGSADEGAAPLVFAGVRGADGIFRSDTGERIDGLASCGGHVAQGGLVSVLGCDDKKGLLLVRAAGKLVTRSPIVTGNTAPAALNILGTSIATARPAGGLNLKLPEPVRDAQLFFGHVLLRGRTPQGETWVAAGQVKDAGSATEALTPFGLLPEEKQSDAASDVESRLAGCRSGQTLVVRVQHARSDFVSFLASGQWTKPVKVPTAGGILSCRKNEASLTGIVPGPADSPLATAVTHYRCTPSACRGRRLMLRELLAGEHGLAPSAVMAAADVGGKLLFVWGAAQRGGLRMRLGAEGRISSTEDIVILDDLIRDRAVQSSSSLLDVRLMARARFAIALLSTKNGVYAVRIKPDGKFVPIPVSWSSR